MLLFALATPSGAEAAGNAHVIDDSEVETPGHCHLEYWGTHQSGSSGIFVFAPACTPKGTRLEIGGFASQSYPGSRGEFAVGPSLKLELRPPGRGPGIAVTTAAAYSLRTDRVESAAVLVPLTVDVAAWLRLNLNAGYVWQRSGDVGSLFVGGQAMVRLSPRLSLMGEAFDRRPFGIGLQSGLRWTPVDWLDVDLLAARRVDGATRNTFTLGLTVRR